MKEKIQCGLCSFGMSGRIFHGPLLKAHPNFEVRKILERNIVKSKDLFPNAQSVKSLSDLLNDATISLIIVNVPDHLHASFTKKALEAGKNVVVEKPFTLTVKDGEELIKFAQDKELGLFVFQNRRWDSDFLTLKKIVESKQLGDIAEIEMHYDRFRPIPPKNTWKEDKNLGPGLLYNLGAHLLDQAVVLAGMPHAIVADLDTLRPNGEIIDYFHLILFYPGFRILIKSSYLVNKEVAKYIVHGNKGSFIKTGSDPQEARLDQGWMADDPKIGKENQSDWGSIYLDGEPRVGKLIESEVGNYLTFYNQVFQDLSTHSTSAVRGDDGILVIKLIEAAQKSSQTGQKVHL